MADEFNSPADNFALNSVKVKQASTGHMRYNPDAPNWTSISEAGDALAALLEDCGEAAYPELDVRDEAVAAVAKWRKLRAEPRFFFS